METTFYIASTFCLILSLVCYVKYINHEEVDEIFRPQDACDESPNAKKRALLYFLTAGLFAVSGILCNAGSKIGAYLGIISCLALLGVTILSLFIHKCK